MVKFQKIVKRWRLVVGAKTEQEGTITESSLLYLQGHSYVD